MKQLQSEVESYCESVLTGQTISGQSEVRAIQRHLADLKELDDFKFSWGHAHAACEWFASLTFPRGVSAGQPFDLHPSQKTLISILFGWRHKSDHHRRRFSRAFVSMARGNGKSPLAAGLGTMLFTADCPYQPGAEVVSVATTRKQSKEYVWIPAGEFMGSVPSLEGRYTIRQGLSEIEFRAGDQTVSKFYPLGSDSNNLDGGSYHAAIVDELHAMRESHRELIEKTETAMKGENSLLIYITTAGTDRSCLWKPEYDYAQKVLRGVVDHPGYFAYIFETDEDDDPFDESCWQKANPLLGTAVSLDRLREMATGARNNPAKRNQWVRYYCNRPVSARDKLISDELWSRGNEQPEFTPGAVVFGGLDKGWRDDLAAFAEISPVANPDDDEKPLYDLRATAWIPEDTKRDLSKPPFPELIASGELIVTEGDVTDHRAILQHIVQRAEHYDLRSVAADPANARSELTELADTHGIPVFEFRQSCDKYNEPTNALLDLMAAGRIRHGGSKLLAWCADNVVAKYNAAGNMMPDKAKASEKIDPIVASIMALSEALFEPVAKQSAYEDRGIRIL